MARQNQGARIRLHAYVGVLTVVLCCAVFQAAGYGVDPALEVNLLEAIAMTSSTTGGIRRVPGYHHEGPTYEFEGGNRNIQIPEEFFDKTKKLLASTMDFTILATVRQLNRNTGSLVSIVHGRARFMELFMSTRNGELRFYYTHKGKVMQETFSIDGLVDPGRWARLALSVSGTHIRLFVDCQETGSRYIPQPDLVMENPELTMWLGQRGVDKTFFKGTMQNVRIIAMPQGFLSQCPTISRDCPTCGQFQAMAHGIQDLEARIGHLEHQLFTAETRIQSLQQCRCSRSCEVNRYVYEDGAAWEDGCSDCTCNSGTPECVPRKCPKLNCKNPVREDGQCCPTCMNSCTTSGVTYGHLEEYQQLHVRVLSSGSLQICTTYQCNNGVASSKSSKRPNCPDITCPTSQRFNVPGHCCQFCPGDNFCPKDTDYCSQGNRCELPKRCVNLETDYTCQCPDGHEEINGNCTDIDECASETDGGADHHCRSGTICVNTDSGYQCNCLPGYSRVTSTTCAQINECETNQHACHKSAKCEDTDGSYRCLCKAGHSGNGKECSVICEKPCLNGGICSSPGQCECPVGFNGDQCEMDVNECEVGSHDCGSHSTCVNLPGGLHCKCDPGYEHTQGTGCTDINECKTANTCHASRLCSNLPGTYECLCTPSGHCSSECAMKKKRHDSGSSWEDNNCQICTCRTGVVTCRPKICDCDSKPDASDYCCPQCRASTQCLHQESATIIYNDGDSWDYQCKKCTCQTGTIQCTDPVCPAPNCLKTYTPNGECCPRCQLHDACERASLVAAHSKPRDMADCPHQGALYTHNQWWFLEEDRCTECTCRNGNICCWYNIACPAS